MFCNNCGKEIQKPGKFCEFCGNKTGIELNAENDNFKIEPIHFSFLDKFNSGQKKLFSFLIIIVITFASTYYFFYSITSPEGVAKSYLKSISSDNYSKSFDYVDYPKSDYITKEIYTKLMKKESYSKDDISSIKVKKNDSGYDDDSENNTKYVKLTYKEGDSSYEEQEEYTLVKKEGKSFFIFPEWKIHADDAEMKCLSDFTITVPSGAQLYFDDKKISTSKKTETNLSDDEISSTDVYEINNIFETTYKIKVKLENALDYKGEIDISNIYDEGVAFEPDKNMKSKISKFFKDYEKAYSEAIKNTDFEIISDYINPESDFWNTNEEVFEEYKKVAKGKIKPEGTLKFSQYNECEVLDSDYIYLTADSENIITTTSKTTTTNSNKIIFSVKDGELQIYDWTSEIMSEKEEQTEELMKEQNKQLSSSLKEAIENYISESNDVNLKFDTNKTIDVETLLTNLQQEIELKDDLDDKDIAPGIYGPYLETSDKDNTSSDDYMPASNDSEGWTITVKKDDKSVSVKIGKENSIKIK